MTRTLQFIAALLAVAALAVAAAADDILDEYQKRYAKAVADTRVSEMEDVVKSLGATGKPDALKALQWCVGASKAAIEDARDKGEKLRAAIAPIEAKIIKKETEYAEQQKKQGKPEPKTRPRFAEDDELERNRAQIAGVDKVVAAHQAVLAEVLDAHGALFVKMPPDAQKAVRDDWTKNRIGSKDWAARAEVYEVLAHVPTDWAFELLSSAVSDKEADARALVAAVDGLAGRDAAKTVPVLVARLDDARWLVRAAVVEALVKTPSKEGIDAIVKRMAKEDGRLKDDCARALKALTGKDNPSNPDMWRIWWAENREKWAGKPAAPDETKAPDPFVVQGKHDPDDSKKTGFFGIQIESKRVVFVIDVSGSMNDSLGGAGPEAKSKKGVLAKSELKRVLGALADGALFDIVFFSTGVKVWKPDMQKADGKTRKEAMDYVDATEIVGATDTYDALEAAFGLGDLGKGKKREADPTGDARVDTIVFLSDGVPTHGRTIDPDAIRTAVKDWNKARRVAIHSVAFGAGQKDGADPKFMKGLADDSGGQFVQM